MCKKFIMSIVFFGILFIIACPESGVNTSKGQESGEEQSQGKKPQEKDTRKEKLYDTENTVALTLLLQSKEDGTKKRYFGMGAFEDGSFVHAELKDDHAPQQQLLRLSLRKDGEILGEPYDFKISKGTVEKVSLFDLGVTYKDLSPKSEGGATSLELILSEGDKEIIKQEFIANLGEVFTWQDLQGIRHGVHGSYILKANIEFPDPGKDGLSEKGFVPIYEPRQHPSVSWYIEKMPFTGKFDGNNKRISNLFINNDYESYAALFGYTKGAEIKNMHIVLKKGNRSTPSIRGMNYVGGLVGKMEGGVIEGVLVKGVGVIRGVGSTGGLVGSMEDGKVQNSFARVTIYGTKDIGRGMIGIPGAHKLGGLVGEMDGGEIRTSSAVAKIEGEEYLGGLVGTTNPYKDVIIRDTFALGKIAGKKHIGGLIGYFSQGEFGSSYANVNVTVIDGGDNKKSGYIIGGLNGLSRSTTMFPMYYSHDLTIKDGEKNIISDGRSNAHKSYVMSSDEFGNMRTVISRMNIERATHADFKEFLFGKNSWVWLGNGEWPQLFWQVNGDVDVSEIM